MLLFIVNQGLKDYSCDLSFKDCPIISLHFEFRDYAISLLAVLSAYFAFFPCKNWLDLIDQCVVYTLNLGIKRLQD